MTDCAVINVAVYNDTMSWRQVEQGIETQTLAIQPSSCPVCREGLYRNVTFLTGGWARCSVCTEVVHYACLSGGAFLKDRPRICLDCKVGRIREGQRMPAPPQPAPSPTLAAAPAEAAPTVPHSPPSA